MTNILSYDKAGADAAISAAVSAAGGALTVVAAITANATLVANRYQPVNASGGAVTVTLPTGQGTGKRITIEKEDSSTNAVIISGQIRSSTTSTINLVWQYESISFVTDSNGYWWPSSGHKTKSSLDAAYVAQSQLSTLATNSFVQSEAFGVPPRVGWMALPPGFISSTAGMPTAGTAYFYPFMVQYPMTVDAIVINVSTAQSGGTTTFAIALYKDDGTGFIDGTQQAIPSTNITLTTSGIVTTTLGTPAVLPAGRYWVGILYLAPSAPTTPAVTNVLNNTVWSLPTPTTIAPGTATRGYSLSSQTALPTTAISSASVNAGGFSGLTVVGLRRSA